MTGILLPREDQFDLYFSNCGIFCARVSEDSQVFLSILLTMCFLL